MLVLKENMLAVFAATGLIELTSNLNTYSSSIEIKLFILYILVTSLAGLLPYIYFSGIGQRILDNASKIISIGAGSTVLYNNWIKGDSSNPSNNDSDDKDDKDDKKSDDKKSDDNKSDENKDDNKSDENKDDKKSNDNKDDNKSEDNEDKSKPANEGKI
jgi:hypothetical protein